MSNFGVRLKGATAILATGTENIKGRLVLALTQELLLANFPDDPEIPQYFRDRTSRIIEELSIRSWRPTLDVDRIRATIHPMRFSTASRFADQIWELYNQFTEYEHSGFIPEQEDRRAAIGRNHLSASQTNSALK